MDDAARVGGGEPLARLQDPRDRVAHARRRPAREPRVEILPIEPLEDEVGLAALGAPDIEDARDVLAVDRRRGARFAKEPLDRARVVRFLSHELDRDAAPEIHVPRGDDDAHTAFAEHAFDAVFLGNERAGLDAHGETFMICSAPRTIQ